VADMSALGIEGNKTLMKTGDIKVSKEDLQVAKDIQMQSFEGGAASKLNIFEERINKSKCLKIVCVALPAHGHMTPISHIAEGLLDRGHDVTMVSCGNSDGGRVVPKKCDPKGIKYVLTVEGEQPEMDMLKNGPKAFKLMFEMWEPSLFKAVKDLQPDIVICDFVTGMLGALAADEMGVPSIINAPAPIQHL